MTRKRGRWAMILAATATALSLGVVACGDDDEGDGGGDGGGTIIRGTIDQPVSYDPAGAYDLPSYDVLVNVYQNLLQIPPGETEPEPEAAESCDFTDDKNTVFECTLKDGLEFSDGSPLTAEDWKFSFDRNIEIADPNGASSLLANLESTEAPDEKTVVFNLKEPDVTWPSLLTAMSFAAVPEEVFPADELQESDKAIGSGRYTVAAYEPGQQTVLEANENYTGDDAPKNDRAIIQYFDKASALKLAVEQGEVDLAYRNLSPTDYDDLEQGGDVEVLGGEGIEIRYLVFNLDLQPGDNDEQKTAIRRAAAYTIDRQAIVDDVYNGTVEPLWSSIPEDLDYATEAFKDEYGETPDPDAAAQELEDAGVDTPVDLEIWWTPTHYGAVSGDEYAEIKRQLEESGLFEVTLKSTEWTQYSEAALTDKYPQFQLGFFPDYPEPDDYAGNIVSSTSFINHHYNNPKVDELLAEEKATTDTAVREEAFTELQALSAADAPIVPVWQGGQTAAVRPGINGVEETFDPAFLFRFWVISKD